MQTLGLSTHLGVSQGANSITSPKTTPETPPSLMSIFSLRIENLPSF